MQESYSTASKNGNGKVYRDYAHVSEPKSSSSRGSSSSSSSSSAAQKDGNKTTKTFPMILHYMLTELEKDGLEHIMAWQPHGRCFIVHEPKQLEKNILPLWFRQSKFASFQRQLNIYGFTRITKGPDSGGYYHELFLRGKMFLAERIQRTKIKGQGPRKPNSAENYPDFEVLPALPSGNGADAAPRSGRASSRTSSNTEPTKPAAAAPPSAPATPVRSGSPAIRPQEVASQSSLLPPPCDAVASAPLAQPYSLQELMSRTSVSRQLLQQQADNDNSTMATPLQLIQQQAPVQNYLTHAQQLADLRSSVNTALVLTSTAAAAAARLEEWRGGNLYASLPSVVPQYVEPSTQLSPLTQAHWFWLAALARRGDDSLSQ